MKANYGSMRCINSWFRLKLLTVLTEYNLRIFWTPQKRGSGGTEVPVGSRGEAQVRGLGTNPVGGMGNEVPQKLTTFLGLKVYFYAKYVNNFIF